jgi:cytochrome c oxidase subunit IV
MKFSMTGQEKSYLLIEVTAQAGSTVFSLQLFKIKIYSTIFCSLFIFLPLSILLRYFHNHYCITSTFFTHLD